MVAAKERPTKLLHVMTVAESTGFLTGQVGYLRSKGFDISVLSSPGQALDQFGADEQVRTLTVDMPRRISPLSDLRALWKIRQHIRELEPQIAHAHTPKGGLLGMAAAWSAGVPVRIYHIHGLPFLTAEGRKRNILRWSERTSCRLATRVLCVSRSIRQVVIDEGFCPASKITVLHEGSVNGVDAQVRFAPQAVTTGVREDMRASLGISPDAAVIGFIGRIVRDKGLIELTEAWSKLRLEYPNLHLLIVGPFEPQDPVPQDVKETLCGDPRVHLVGLDWNTPPYYSAMDIVTLPSYREGFPSVPLEAAAMELPVVATRIPGCIDAVVDGVTGTLVPPRNGQALANALRAYLESAELRRKHGAEGRKRVLRDYRQEAIWEAVHTEYSRLLRVSGASGGS